MDTLEKLLHKYFMTRAELIYKQNPWVFYALESALVSLAGGIHLIKGRDFHVEPAMHFITLTGRSGRGKNWIFGVFEDLADGIFRPLPFGSGQAFLEALQEEVNKTMDSYGIAKAYAFFDEASLLTRNINSWGGDLADFMSQLWNGGRLVWRTRSKQKPNIEIPGKSYIVSLFLATTIQRWSVLEAKLGDTGWTRRFWVLNIDAEVPYVQDEQPDIEVALKLFEMRRRIQIALRALKHYRIRVAVKNLAETNINEKLKNLKIPELKKFSVGEYALRLMASRLVASSVEVPKLDEFKTPQEATSWIKERLKANLENKGVEVAETPDWLANSTGIQLEGDLRPWEDYIISAKVVGGNIFANSPRDALHKARQLKLDELTDPLNIDMTLIFVGASLAEVIQASTEELSDIMYALEDYKEKGCLVIPRREFARIILAKGRQNEYNYVIRLLHDAGVIRAVNYRGESLDEIEARGERPSRLYIVTDPKARICANCKHFLGSCPLLKGVTDSKLIRELRKLERKACKAFESRDAEGVAG